MTEKMVHTHKWMDAGLGVAPFRAVDIISLPSPSLAEANVTAYNNAMAAAWHQSQRYGVSCGSCDACGQSLVNNVVIRGADGKHFVVGLDCAGKTSDSKLITEVQHLEKQRLAAIREAKRAAEDEARRQRYLERLQAERDANGGLTNAEVAQKKADEAAELARQKYTAENEWLISVLRKEYPGDFVRSMIESLSTASTDDLSDRTISILGDIYAKSFGRRNSKKYDAALEEFIAKTDIPDEEKPA